LFFLHHTFGFLKAGQGLSLLIWLSIILRQLVLLCQIESWKALWRMWWKEALTSCCPFYKISHNANQLNFGDI
jgi:hypothetical protein